MRDGRIQRFRQRFPKLVKEQPFLDELHSKTRQYLLWQLRANIKALGGLKRRGRRVGRIRFRGKGRFKTFVYNQSGFKVVDGRLHLSKIGDIPLKQHREIVGEVKQVIVKRSDTNKWYAIFSVESKCSVRTDSKKRVGIDVGINHYVVDSDGKVTEHPHVLNKHLCKLARVQRRFHKQVKGSNNRAKQRVIVASNGALNILHKAQSRQNGMSALKEIGTGCPEYTPAEIRPILDPIGVGQAESMKQEAPCESVG